MNAQSENHKYGWISQDLDKHISDALNFFEAYLSNPEGEKEKAKLAASLEATNKIVKIFSETGLLALEDYVNEITELIEQLIRHEAYNKYDAYQVIIGGFNQLQNYLTATTRENKDEPVQLIAVVNDLRATSGKRLFLPENLFSPEVNQGGLLNSENIKKSVADIDKIVLLNEAASLKQQIDIINNSQENSKQEVLALEKLAIQGLQQSQITNNIFLREIWCSIVMIIEGSLKHSERLSLCCKYTILNTLDGLLRLSNEENQLNEADFVNFQILFKELLFCISSTFYFNQNFSEFTHKYRLDNAIQLGHSGLIFRLGTPDVETTALVIDGLITDLNLVTTCLQSIIEAGENKEKSQELVDMTTNLQFTLKLVQFTELSSKLEIAIKAFSDLSKEKINIEHQSIEAALAALYDIEEKLNKTKTGGVYDSNQLAIIEQAGNSTEEIISLIDTYGKEVDKYKKNEIIESISNLLSEISGVTSFLNSSLLTETLDSIENYFDSKVKASFVSNQDVFLEAILTNLTKALSCVLKFFEHCIQSRHELVNKNLTQALELLVDKENSANNLHLTLVGKEANDIDSLEPESEPVAEMVQDYINLSLSDNVDTTNTLESDELKPLDDSLLDDEIVEIFLEEAEEVLEELTEAYSQLSSDSDNAQALSEVRRAYHTLKGSGRMAGAEHIGEAAWAIENMLNRVIDKSVSLNDMRLGLVGEANRYMPTLVQSFKEKLEPYTPALQSLITRAENVSQNEEAEIVIGETETLLNAMLERQSTVALEDASEAISEAENIIENVDEIEGTVEKITGDLEFETTENQDNSEEYTSLVEELSSTNLIEIFLDEVKVQIAVLRDYLALNTHQADESHFTLPGDALVRVFHTLAGSARITQEYDIAELMLPMESLLVNINRKQEINTKQYELIEQITQWLENYSNNYDKEVEKQSLAELIDAVNHELSSSIENPVSAEFARLMKNSLLLAQPNVLLKQWRVSGSAPDNLNIMLSELDAFSEYLKQQESVSMLLGSMKSAYQAFNQNGLHYAGYKSLLEAHGEFDDMANRYMAGQIIPDSKASNKLQNIIEEDKKVLSVDSSSIHTEKNTDDLDDEVITLFLEESNELLDEISESIKQWLENKKESHYMETLLRPLHTIKGGARMAGCNDIADICHEFEALLQAAKLGDVAVNARFFTQLTKFENNLTNGFSQISNRKQVVQNDSSTDVVEKEQDKRVVEQVRVSADLLDKLIGLAGETSISRSLIEEKLNDFSHSIEEIDTTVERLKEQLRRLEIETEAQINFRKEQVEMEGHEEFDPLEMDRYSKFQQLSKSLVESASDLKDLKSTLKEKTRDVETLLLQQGRINTGLQEGLMRTQTVPLSRVVIPRLRRTILQVSGELDKTVSFEVLNAEGELDRSIIERMVAPLEHVLRNAIDHGIESPNERKAAGKPEHGSIQLDIHREGGDIIIKLSDDGRGIDTDQVRQKAIANGLMNEGDELSDQEINQFIFSAGFTTANKITQISGRGVGMEVVQQELRELGGTVQLQSVKGKGVTFIFKLPFTVSMNRALLVSAGGESMAVPMDSIEGIVRISPYELKEYYEDSSMDFVYAGQTYDFMYFGSLINGSEPNYCSDMIGALPVLLVRSNERLVALQVDRLVGSREIVVKSLGNQFAKLAGVSGATVLGDGSVVMIADLAVLVNIKSDTSTNAGKGVNAQLSRERPLAMVVDDSVTVRKVTTRLLERNGFEVITAKDGMDAMEKLEDTIPDFMLLDIEMPRLDGFEVVSRVRHDSQLKEMPIIMISSRTGDKHKDRAVSLGANDFMGKPYQEQQLLAKINEFLPESFKQYVIQD